LVVLSTDREMISARSVIGAHAQDFLTNELLPPILKSFAQCTRSLHTTRNVWCFHSSCSSRTIM